MTQSPGPTRSRSNPGYPYPGSTYAFALNDEHYVAGAQYSFYNFAEHRVPFLWHEAIPAGGDGKMIQLTVPFNTLQCEVFGMNKDGVMVGYAYSNTGTLTGVLWQNAKDFSMTSRLDAAAVSAGWSVQKLWDINDNGAIVASAYRPGFQGLVLLVPDPAVQLITPSGDPINAPVAISPAPCASPSPTPAPVDGQNEFTFNDCNPGVLAVHLKAKVLAPGTAGSLASRCRFTIDPIAGSTMVWATNNANGQPTNASGSDFLEADVTFTGLPTSNSSFGRKNVTITVDGTVRDQKAMEVFFKRDEKNHPGVDNGTTPNWYYYWLQTVTLLGPNPRVFYSATGGSAYDPNINSFTLSNGDRLSYNAPYGLSNPLEGIDNFAWTAIHESQHYADWVTLWDVDNSGISRHQAAVGQSGPDEDLDGDRISNRVEDVNLNGVYDAGDLSDWQIYNTPTAGRDPAIINDFEEWNCQRHKDAKGDHRQDWADPGMQHLILDNYND